MQEAAEARTHTVGGAGTYSGMLENCSGGTDGIECGGDRETGVVMAGADRVVAADVGLDVDTAEVGRLGVLAGVVVVVAVVVVGVC